MHLKQKNKVIDVSTAILGAICIIISLICFFIRLPKVLNNKKENIELFAAGFILPEGDKKGINPNKTKLKESKVSSRLNLSKKSNIFTPAKDESNEDSDDDNNLPLDENAHKIIETQFGAGGIHYENFYVKNDTGLNIDIGKYLSQDLDIDKPVCGNPKVLIVHTHTSESYMEKDQGFFYDSFYPRSTDYNKNVTRVGNAIAEKLKQNGIEAIHDLTYHDIPSYNGSYSRSEKTIRSNLEKYPSIQVVLDIHRDSIGNNEIGKTKPTFKVNGKKAAQIMIMSGCDEDGSLEFPDWEYNFRFALKLQKAAEDLYPGMTRPMYFGGVKYNMDITHSSTLIEVGSDANTLEEAIYTGSLLGDVLYKVLSNLP